jgi:hypothetical protein
MLNPCDLAAVPAGRDHDASAAGRHAGSGRRAARILTSGDFSAYRRGWPDCREHASTTLAAARRGAPSGSTADTTRPSAASRLRQIAEYGSQTTEYALLLIVAATITMLALTWAKQGAIKGVLDGVIGQVLALFGIGAG